MGILYTRNSEGVLTPVHTVRVVNEESREGLDTVVHEFNQMNDLVTAYLAAADAAYTDDNGDSVSVIANYETVEADADRPVGYPLSIAGYGTLYLQNEDSGHGCLSQAKGGDWIRGSVFNAVPGKISQYLVKDSDGNLLENGRIKPTGKVRMIRFAGNHRNCRDLGGWACDGGTVKYGKLFRSATTVYLEDWIDPQIAKNIGIKHHIDFRSDAEANHRTESPFGSEVRYQRIAISNYYADSIALDGTDMENLKKFFRAVFDVAAHNEGLLYHCSLGRDRTGAVTFMILALLGVARADIDKDYELTSFSGTYAPEMTPAHRNTGSYPGMGTYLATMNGTSFRNNVVKWFVEAGFTLDELNAFRSAMIDGNPGLLTEADLETAEPDIPAEPDEPTTYTNLVRTAKTEPYGEEVYNGVGYCNGKYVSSSAANSYSSDSACVVTGNIPVTVTYGYFPTVYIKGITIDTSANSHCRFYFNSEDETVLAVNVFDIPDRYTFTRLADQYYKLEPVMNDDGKAAMCHYIAPGDISFRLSGIGTGETLIVTIDEPIE